MTGGSWRSVWLPSKLLWPTWGAKKSKQRRASRRLSRTSPMQRLGWQSSRWTSRHWGGWVDLLCATRSAMKCFHFAVGKSNSFFFFALQNLGERNTNADDLIAKVTKLEHEKLDLRSQLGDVEVSYAVNVQMFMEFAGNKLMLKIMR